MDIKNFCDAHWTSEEHGEEPTKLDGGGRMLVFAPEGEACGFCPKPATHTAPYEATREAPAKLPSVRPAAYEDLTPTTGTRKSLRP